MGRTGTGRERHKQDGWEAPNRLVRGAVGWRENRSDVVGARALRGEVIEKKIKQIK